MLRWQNLFNVVDGSDSADVVIRKKTVFYLNLVGMISSILAFFMEFVDTRMKYFDVPGIVVGAVFFVHLLVTRYVSRMTLAWNLIAYSLSIFVLDWILAAHAEQKVWPFVVLLLDANLVADGAPAVSFVLLGATMLWMATLSLDLTVNFGVLASVPMKWSPIRVCDCGDPPCPMAGVALAVSDVVPGYMVLCLDFYFSRRFANSLNSANRSMQASISIAKSVAHVLAAFDLEAASSHLTDSESLSPDLKEAFDQILTNLTNYKPYLPEAILSASCTVPETRARDDAPGRDDGVASIVFTDIKSSTATWQSEPTAMKHLRIHNTVVRNTIRQFNGYEVKTIGDSFMIAFETLENAVSFGLASQVVLYEQEWPVELMTLPQCARLAGVWNGLRIRVGVHYGEVEVELNSVNERFDYFGTTVNKAARLEGVCPPGGRPGSQCCRYYE